MIKSLMIAPIDFSFEDLIRPMRITIGMSTVLVLTVPVIRLPVTIPVNCTLAGNSNSLSQLAMIRAFCFPCFRNDVFLTQIYDSMDYLFTSRSDRLFMLGSRQQGCGEPIASNQLRYFPCVACSRSRKRARDKGWKWKGKEERL